MFDVAKVRKDFPILEEQVYGKRLVYLDNGATTQRPLQVIEKMNEYYLKYRNYFYPGYHGKHQPGGFFFRRSFYPGR